VEERGGCAADVSISDDSDRHALDFGKEFPVPPVPVAHSIVVVGDAVGQVQEKCDRMLRNTLCIDAWSRCDMNAEVRRSVEVDLVISDPRARDQAQTRQLFE